MLSYEYTFYKPSYHFYKRYKQRMPQQTTAKELKKQIGKASMQELARRANFMLLFSIHGRWGNEPDTEVRYYFGWNIVVNNKNKQVLTMYHDDKRQVLPARLFGERRIRDMIYDLMFRPKSKIGRAAYA